MATVQIVIRNVEDVEDLKRVLSGIVEEIGEGNFSEGCSDYEFFVDGKLGGVIKQD